MSEYDCKCHLQIGAHSGWWSTLMVNGTVSCTECPQVNYNIPVKLLETDFNYSLIDIQQCEECVESLIIPKEDYQQTLK